MLKIQVKLQTSEIIQTSFHISTSILQEKIREKSNMSAGRNSVVPLVLGKKKINKKKTEEINAKEMEGER